MSNNIRDYLHFHCPTSEQKVALLALQEFVKEDNQQDFFILCGAAGTGKTSITSALIGYLNAHEIDYAIAAPTGRAARILGRKTKSMSGTIHSKIYTIESDKNTGSVKFKLRPNRNKDFSIFIIDEASMLSSISDKSAGMFSADDSLLNHVREYIKQGNSKNKVIFLGDKNQLPPINEVESKALNPGYLVSNFGWTGSFHYLTEVKRQQDGSYILKNAIELRKAIDNNCFAHPCINAYRHKNTFVAARQFANQFTLDDSDKAIAIGVSHKANKIFNDEVRKHLFNGKTPLVMPGDLMLVTQNWKTNDHVLFNGDHVIVEEVMLDKTEELAGLHFAPIRLRAKGLDDSEEIIEDYMILDILVGDRPELDSIAEKNLRAERFRKNKQYSESSRSEDDKYIGALRLAYGYAITCHKAQGGEWDKVFINTFGVKDLRWTYTAVTRAKENLEVY